MIRVNLPVLAAFLLTLAHGSSARADIVTFEDLVLSPGTYQEGSTLSPAGSFSSGGATFNNSYDSEYGSWFGWSYSNVVDKTTPGFGNQWAAYAPAGGDASSNYAVAYQAGYLGEIGTPKIVLPDGQAPVALRITNTTYGALAMRDGYFGAKKFGGVSGTDPDFLKLTIKGVDANDVSTGAINFYLADYSFSESSQDYIVSDWTTVDLSGLSNNTRALLFELTSSDNHPVYGINTPATFALDNLQTAAVPEPNSLALVLLGCAAAGYRSLRRKSQQLDGSRFIAE